MGAESSRIESRVARLLPPGDPPLLAVCRP